MTTVRDIVELTRPQVERLLAQSKWGAYVRARLMLWFRLIAAMALLVGIAVLTSHTGTFSNPANAVLCVFFTWQLFTAFACARDMQRYRDTELGSDGFRRSCTCTPKNICWACYDLLPSSHIDKHCRYNLVLHGPGPCSCEGCKVPA